MNTHVFIKTIIITLFCFSVSLIASEQDVQQFFKAANKGFYQVMLDLAQKKKITAQEIISARDTHGNSLIGAALQGYTLAKEKYGASKAADLLFGIIALLLPNLSKQETINLLNTENKAGITPLFIATQEGLLKIVVFLHEKGALSVIKSGKKASEFTNNAQLKMILKPWQDLEGDWQFIHRK
jgi:ankyrin repeat protein